MKGRHTGARQRPESAGAAAQPTRRGDVDDEDSGNGSHENGEGSGRLLKKVALWVGSSLCIAFIAWVAWGFIQFDHDIEHPREGGFSGWQCDAGRDCGS
ncbi:hypothetical protein QIS99_00475 [Streptomyces sp. B-S-A8]|uniref:Uncharacterized protein n=1 Tax=Streptomyces solicavernae TaxID=3043614 RepID=A0ABT6RM07_9ACTN|nr:hypothetical protein [Streptomyces sp. B-S-A8]MDI3384701.1 hypothetical protein [Streptomyces sp. B-S-A8]